MTDTTWSVASHDVVPPVDFALHLGEVPTYLHALLRAEHSEFTEPYTEVRNRISEVIDENSQRARPGAQAPRPDVSPERLRTWKKVFEEFGLLYVEDDQRLRATALGRLVNGMHDDLRKQIEGANDHVIRLGLSVLSRHTLRNPTVSAAYPPETDVHPYRAIWRACRALDDRLHWEELNRVLMGVLREDDVESSISHIQSIRASVGGSYTTSSAVEALGQPCVAEGAETRRRITPWLTKAGFGGVLLSSDDEGFWHLNPTYLPLIDSELAEPPVVPDGAMNSRRTYLEYVASGATTAAHEPGHSERTVFDETVAAARRYGSQKIIALSGLPSTGKSRMARMVADALSENDPYRVAEIQFHENTTYDKFIEGFTPRRDGSGFELLPMTLRVINDRALRDPGRRTYVLLIEELTRANVHSVLGELLTFIEHRDRKFRLLLSQQETQIAKNLVVLATMNPRDKSALSLDQAILRRLHQISIPPSSEVLRELASANLDPTTATRLCDWFDQFLGILPFGHGEFSDAHSPNELRALWRGTLVHFFTDGSGQVRPIFRDVVDTYPWQ